jgi:GNAT superfamily N-acetyltransferase
MPLEVWRAPVLRVELAGVPRLPIETRGIEVRPYTGPDWTPLERLVGQRALPAFARGVALPTRQLLVAWSGERAVGHLWLANAADPAPELLDLELPPAALYLWELHVARGSRGCGIGVTLVRSALTYARELGGEEVWAVVPSDDPAPWRVGERASFGTCEVAGTLHYRRLFSRIHARFDPRPRREEPVARLAWAG